jgi:hypothetical protein
MDTNYTSNEKEETVFENNGKEALRQTEDQVEYFKRIIDFHDKALTRVLETSKWSITALISLMVISGGLLGLQNWSYRESLKSEQKDLKEELRGDISERLGKLNAKSNLEILNVNGRFLEGSDVKVTRITATNRDRQGAKIPITEVTYVFPLFFKNNGDGAVDYATFKIYNNDFEVQTPSTINSYKYEIYNTIKAQGSNDKIPIIHSKTERSDTLEITSEIKNPLPNGEYRIPNGKYPVRISVVYPEVPNAQSSSYKFNLIIDNNSKYISFRK